MKKELLKPTKIYVKEIISLSKKNLLNGCANITGGGIKDNLERVIPNGLAARLSLGKIKVLKIFKYLNKMGVKDKDKLQTFNCGVAIYLIVNKKKIKTIEKHFQKKFKPYLIGEIINSKHKVKFDGKINWE